MRLSRRHATRPSAACRAAVAACNSGPSQFSTVCPSALVGCVFFFGGISRFSSWEKTFPHVSALAGDVKFGARLSSRTLPFCVSAS